MMKNGALEFAVPEKVRESMFKINVQCSKYF